MPLIGKEDTIDNEKKKKHSRRGLSPAAIAAVILAALLLGSALGAVLYLNNAMRSMNTVYPGVSVNGVELSNLTHEEAEKVLTELEEGAYRGYSVSVKLPMNTTLSVSVEDVNLQLHIEDALNAAWDYGRSGSWFQRLTAYVRHRYFAATAELSAPTSRSLDEAALKSLVGDTVTALNDKLVRSSYRIGKYSINILKGAFAMNVDEGKIIEVLRAAILDADPTPIVYEQELKTDEGVDLERLHAELCHESVSSVYDPATGQGTPSEQGLDFDLEEAKKLWAAAAYGETVAIPLITSEPEMSQDELNALLFRDVLGEKSTSLAGSTQNRINNVTKACEKLSAVTLQPGETFSYNDCLGQRNAENGWWTAGAYVDGQVVEEYGGGICQVSSTLFVACLLSDVKINTRSCHYFPVSYLPAGYDATVSWGGPEYKFTNDREYPIRIHAFVENGSVTVQLIGTDLEHNTVELCSSDIEELEAEDKTMVDNAGNVVTVGYRVTIWCKVYDADGKLIKGGNGDYHKYYSVYNYHTEDIEAKLAKKSEDVPEISDTPIFPEEDGGGEEIWW